MIGHKIITLVISRYHDYRTQIVYRLIRILCKAINTDVDFEPYKYLDAIVSIAVQCGKCKDIFYIRDGDYLGLVHCPTCMEVCKVFMQGNIVRLVIESQKKETK